MAELPYAEIFRAVQHLAPTWCKTQHTNLALLLVALVERPSLCLSELARALPEPGQSLHGRLKRLDRFLDNPRLDELGLGATWLRLSYRFGAELPDLAPDGPLLPVLVDTTYFEPFAALIASVPCGARGLPIALTTYHRQELAACFPPRTTWPDPHTAPPARRRAVRPAPAAATVTPFLSQNQIESRLLELVWHLVSPGITVVAVMDRGFARASLFQDLLDQQREFVVRVKADTHVSASAAGPSQPVAMALAIQPGERRWVTDWYYQQEARVPVNLLAVWDQGQEEPWYLASSLARPDWTEALYRWRMRIESGNRDEKTGVILREGGDDHMLQSVLHLHRLLLALMTLQWLCALVGLQAHHDLGEPAAPTSAPPEVAPRLPPPAPEAAAVAPPPLRLEDAPPTAPPADLLAQGPSLPPPVLPHRGPTPKLPRWMRRFAARGHLSYLRLGMEVLRAPDLAGIVRRLAHWLGIYLWCWTPLWRPRQRRYRLQRWWSDTS